MSKQRYLPSQAQLFTVLPEAILLSNPVQFTRTHYCPTLTTNLFSSDNQCTHSNQPASIVPSLLLTSTGYNISYLFPNSYTPSHTLHGVTRRPYFPQLSYKGCPHHQGVLLLPCHYITHLKPALADPVHLSPHGGGGSSPTL